MSRLEVSFQAAVSPLVGPVWPEYSQEFMESLSGHSHNIIRWLIKTAIIVEQAFPKSIASAITSDMIEVAKGDLSQVDYYWFCGHIAESDLNVRLTKGFPTLNGMQFHPYQVHKESISFGIHLNHLGLLLIRCPGAKPGFAGKYKLVDGRLCVPLINGQRPRIGRQHPVHSFPNFQAFLESVEIWATLPPETENHD